MLLPYRVGRKCRQQYITSPNRACIIQLIRFPIYGYSGYATNTYASSRLSSLGPIVDLSIRTLIFGVSSFVQPNHFTQGAYGYQLPFTLEEGNDDPVGLTNAVLTITVQTAGTRP